MKPFLEALDDRVLVCDGAMGTMLYQRGVFLNRSFDELNIAQPDLVAEVHQAYVRAGADVIETNTFGANRIKLAHFGLADSIHTMNLQGARIARHAAREYAYVAGSIGPLGVRIEPWGKMGADEAEALFREQAEALEEGGVDLFVLETFRDLNEVQAAIRAVRSVSAKPIVAQVTTEEDGNTLDGTPPETFTPALETAGADVIGLNCSVGPAAMLETLERMSRLTALRLSAQPNAGRPRDVEGRNIYLSSPEYMASYARRFVSHGVKLVGGCCGTTPEHIKHIRQAVRALPATRTFRTREAAAASRTASTAAAPPAGPAAPAIATREKSRLAAAFASRQFVVAAELLPPRGYETEDFVATARDLKRRGIDLIAVPDYHTGGARMSALLAAALVEQRAGAESLLHYSCRDRNLISMQADLLGAHALGLRNVLVVTGEPGRAGDYADATSVFDVDSIGLTNMATRLNHGFDVGGQTIGRPTSFHIGVAFNPFAVSPDQEQRRFAFKQEAGAEFVVLPPVFDTAGLADAMPELVAADRPVLAGLHVLADCREAEFLANEVPGVRIPDAILTRMRTAEAEGRAAGEGLQIAVELAGAMAGLVSGIVLSGADALADAADAIRAKVL
ncbi:MAG: bifunctional homocysteine S-methyltransferase/methylenetetrahydrofolate reductase [Vicinamibacterales bacterium]